MIVGGGHNGLVAAHYLASAGLRTIVCERREIVGGCCVTEEFAPGFRASTGAYVLSMLREPVWRDLRLVERGIAVDPAGPALNLFADGSTLHLDDDLATTQDEIRRFSPADARALPEFEDRAGRDRDADPAAVRHHPARSAPTAPARAGDARRARPRAARNRARISDALFLFGTSANQYLSEYFESEQVRAALGWHAINDSTGGPSTPGTAFVLLHDHASDAAGGGIRQWGFVRGGIGRAHRGDGRRGARGGRRDPHRGAGRAAPDRGRPRRGRACSQSGEEVRAARVLSNADPKTTFLRLVDEALLPARLPPPPCAPTAARARA